MDKAGAYGIQNPEISPVASIDGDYYNVVGLPLAALYQLLAPIYPEIIQAPPDQNNSPNCD
jgi:predicted house-cleaning NTP pyrophosphatase (Maf/HAM1 superfamily)